MVETIRLESGHTLTGIVGSNPTLSASSNPASIAGFSILRGILYTICTRLKFCSEFLRLRYI